MNRSGAFDRVALGATDVLVSRLAWGMWRFLGDDLAHARALVDAAFDAGINLFDTADIYGFNGRVGFGDAEILLGRLFAADAGLRRRMVLASKGGISPGVPYDSSAGLSDRRLRGLAASTRHRPPRSVPGAPTRRADAPRGGGASP